MKNYNMILTEKKQKKSDLTSGKIDKYEYLTGKETLPPDHSSVSKQAKLTCSPKRKTLEKQTKTTEDQGRKQKDATWRGTQKNFNELIELTDKANPHDLGYYFKGNNARRRFGDFNNGIKLLNKTKSGDMKLEEVKKLQDVFKSYLNKISRGAA